ncbi:MAG: hypothetical protein ACYCWW_06155 [Deltaproteobacteria bacterium]
MRSNVEPSRAKGALIAALALAALAGCQCRGQTAAIGGGDGGLDGGDAGALRQADGGPGRDAGTDGGFVCGLRSCASVGANCGPIGDGCGGVLECGSCTAPEICGGAGKPSVCGGNAGTCKPLTCATAGATCGAVGDGCGAILQCGSCSAPNICGGGGVPNACGDAAAGPADAGPGCQGTLAITPATATLQVASGTPSSLQLQAVVSGCGAPQVVTASWISSRPDLASVGTTTGLVSAQGPRGGAVVVSAGYRGLVAVSQLTVVVTETVFSGAPPSAPQAFGQPPTLGSTSSPAFLYPNDQVVIPVNLQPLDFQWRPGAGNGLYRVTLSGSYATLVGYVSPASPTQPAWQPDPVSWANFAESNVGQKVTLDLAGSSGASGAPVYGATEQTLTLAASRFAGTIYYWAISAGQVLRLSAGSQSPVAFYTPPLSPSGSNHCIACHTVSRDGTQMSAELWGAGQASSATILSLAQNPVAPTLPGGSQSWMFSAFDDTGTRLLTTWKGSLTLRDAPSGAPVPAGSGQGNLGSIGCGTGSTCSHPAWSPDGTTVLFAKGLAGHFSYDVDFDESDLMTVPWSAGPQAFGAPSVLVPSNLGGTALANFHPTFSIDDALVAFNRGPCSRSDGSAACPTTCPQTACGVTGNVPPSTLELVPATGGSPIELSAAEGSDVRNWYPNFSPFKEGGYHWLAFFSLRDYGWVTAGQNQRQIWVTAVDDGKAPSSDPSHPSFWLPGQDPTTLNDKAEWAPLPCVGSGQGCQGDIDCCSGLLCREADGGSSCLPAAQACGFTGAGCQSAADCCAPLACLGTGICGTPCGTAGGGCQATSDCCSGLGCDAGLCVGPSCTPKSCAAQGFDCGAQGDGCGNPIDCGGCDAGSCGGGGQPGVCGSGCIPESCAQLHYDCGAAGDGCGGLLECGSCDAGSCGGGGVPNVCYASQFR